MGDVAFPVYVLCKDSKEIYAFSSYLVMRGYLEAIDVGNDEYDAVDANGFRLRLSVGTPKSEWLEIERTPAQLSAGEFAAIKTKAKAYKEPKPFLRTLLRKSGLSKG